MSSPHIQRVVGALRGVLAACDSLEFKLLRGTIPQAITALAEYERVEEELAAKAAPTPAPVVEAPPIAAPEPVRWCCVSDAPLPHEAHRKVVCIRCSLIVGSRPCPEATKDHEAYVVCVACQRGDLFAWSSVTLLTNRCESRDRALAAMDKEASQ